MNMMHARANPLSLLRKLSATAQAIAPLKGALQSTWGITRGYRMGLKGLHSNPTERRHNYG